MKIKREAVNFRHSGWWKKLSSIFHIDGVWGCAGRTLNRLSRLWEQQTLEFGFWGRAGQDLTTIILFLLFSPQASLSEFLLVSLHWLVWGVWNPNLKLLQTWLWQCLWACVILLPNYPDLCLLYVSLRWGLAGRRCWSMEGLLWLARSRVARHTLLHDDWEGD